MEKPTKNSFYYSSWFISGVLAITGGAYYLYRTFQSHSKEKEDILQESKVTEFDSYLNTTISTHNIEQETNDLLYKKLEPYLNKSQISILQQRIDYIKEIIFKSSDTPFLTTTDLNDKSDKPEFQVLSKEVTCEIIGIVKELADFILSKRNKDYINERRNSVKKSNYEELCKDFFNIYTFCLNISKKNILRLLSVKSKIFKSSIEFYSNDDIFYSSICYYSNIFGNLSNNSICELNTTTLENMFKQYCNRLIIRVSEIEGWLKQQIEKNISEEELNNLYAIKLNYARLQLSDEIFKQYNADEYQIKFYLFIKNKLDPRFNMELFSLLERINGVELIALGFS